MGRNPQDDPLVGTIEIRWSGEPLTCSCRPKDQHIGAPFIVLIDGEWHGDASCGDHDHLEDVIGYAIRRHMLVIEPADTSPAASSDGGAT